MSSDDEPGEDENWLFYDLAERLRVAHKRVAALSPESDRQIMTRRLLAISDAAKHDLRRASRRLDHFLAELPAQAGEDQAPSG